LITNLLRVAWYKNRGTHIGVPLLEMGVGGGINEVFCFVMSSSLTVPRITATCLELMQNWLGKFSN
jgi:hypothetical protein